MTSGSRFLETPNRATKVGVHCVFLLLVAFGPGEDSPAIGI